MKARRRVFRDAAAVGFCCVLSLRATLVASPGSPIFSLSTGFDDAAEAVLPVGVPDDDYAVDPGTGPEAATTGGPAHVPTKGYDTSLFLDGPLVPSTDVSVTGGGAPLGPGIYVELWRVAPGTARAQSVASVAVDPETGRFAFENVDVEEDACYHVTLSRSWQFNTDGDAEGWDGHVSPDTTVDVSGGVLKVTIGDSNGDSLRDAYFHNFFDYDPSVYRVVEVRLKNPVDVREAGSENVLGLFWGAPWGFEEGFAVSHHTALIPGNMSGFQTILIPMNVDEESVVPGPAGERRDGLWASGTLNDTLRLDPLDAVPAGNDSFDGAVFEIDLIRIREDYRFDFHQDGDLMGIDFLSGLIGPVVADGFFSYVTEFDPLFTSSLGTGRVESSYFTRFALGMHNRRVAVADNVVGVFFDDHDSAGYTDNGGTLQRADLEAFFLYRQDAVVHLDSTTDPPGEWTEDGRVLVPGLRVDAPEVFTAGDEIRIDYYGFLPESPAGPSDPVCATPASNPSWVPNDSYSLWVSSSSSLVDAPGVYSYQFSCNVPEGVDPARLVISGAFAADDVLLGVWINDRSTGISGGGFAALTPFPPDAGLGLFQAGENVIRFEVRNFGEALNPTGLRIDAYLALSELGGCDSTGTGAVGVFDNALDIGAPPTAGATTYDAGTDTYTMTASGADIWLGGDQFHLAYLIVTGDFVATSRVTRRIDPPSDGRWGKHGLMARYTCNFDSKYTMVQTNLSSPGEPVDEPRHAFRVTHRQAASTREPYVVDDGIFENRRPPWMRLVRVGPAIYSYLAEDLDGDDRPDEWVLAGSDVDPARPTTLLVGMALTAHTGDTGVTGTIAFDKFAIEPLEIPERPVSQGPDLDQCHVMDFEDPDQILPEVVIVTPQDDDFPPQVIGGRLRLTEEGMAASAGTVWFFPPQCNLMDDWSDGFRAEFDVFMSRTGFGIDPAVRPAEGLCFAVVQYARGEDPRNQAGLDVSTLSGGTHGDLGYGGHSLVARTENHPSFAVEIDTWVGGGEPGNEPSAGGSPSVPGAYHVGLDVNAAVTSVQTNEELLVPVTALPDVFLPVGVHVKVDYIPILYASGNAPSLARVEVHMAPGDGSEVPRRVISTVIPALDPEGELLMAFTAATGPETCTQEVDNVRVSSPKRNAAAELTFGGDLGGDVKEDPGTEHARTVDCTLTSDPALGGARAWSFGVAAEGMRIASITTSGTPVEALAAEGFTITEVTDGGGGAVSAVLLSYTDPSLSLPVGEETVVARIGLQGTFPAAGKCTQVRLLYVDGLRGSGLPVDTVVTVEGTRIRPRLDEFPSFTLCSTRPVIRVTTPIPLDFDEVEAGATKTLPVRFTNEGDLALILGTVEIRSGGDVFSIVSAPLHGTEVPPGGNRDIRVRYAPETDGIDEGFLVIPSNDPDHPEFEVRLIGVGTIPVVELSPERLDFYDVEVNTPSRLSLEIWNRGRANLVLSSVDLGAGSDSSFRLENPLQDEVVRPNRNATVTVTFMPPTVGAHSGTLVILSNDPATPRAEVPLTGTGIPPPEPAFGRGDANADDALNLTDPIFTLTFLFLGGEAPSCRDAADSDDNGRVDITDAIYVLSFLFLGGPPPKDPFRTCGFDLTDDALSCDAFAPCAAE